MNAIGRKLLMAAALAAGPLLAMSAAHADEISLGGASGNISFSNAGGGDISFTTNGFAGTNTATFESPTGTAIETGNFTLGSMTGTAGPESSGVFPITAGGTESFSYIGNSGNTLSGTVTWAGIKDNTTTPAFDVGSHLTVTASSGSPLFTSDFKAGSTPEIDFTIAGPSTLTALAGGTVTGPITFTFSSGEVMPAVPEPASLTLFGTALLGLGLFLGLRRSKRV